MFGPGTLAALLLSSAAVLITSASDIPGIRDPIVSADVYVNATGLDGYNHDVNLRLDFIDAPEAGCNPARVNIDGQALLDSLSITDAIWAESVHSGSGTFNTNRGHALSAHWAFVCFRQSGLPTVQHLKFSITAIEGQPITTAHFIALYQQSLSNPVLELFGADYAILQPSSGVNDDVSASNTGLEDEHNEVPQAQDTANDQILSLRKTIKQLEAQLQRAEQYTPPPPPPVPAPHATSPECTSADCTSRNAVTRLSHSDNHPPNAEQRVLLEPSLSSVNKVSVGNQEDSHTNNGHIDNSEDIQQPSNKPDVHIVPSAHPTRSLQSLEFHKLRTDGWDLDRKPFLRYLAIASATMVFSLAVITGFVVACLRQRCRRSRHSASLVEEVCREQNEPKPESCDNATSNPNIIDIRGVLSAFGLHHTGDEIDDEEKRTIAETTTQTEQHVRTEGLERRDLLEELHSSESTHRAETRRNSFDSIRTYESDSDMSTTMEQDLARFRQAASIIENMMLPNARRIPHPINTFRNPGSDSQTLPPSPSSTSSLPMYKTDDDKDSDEDNDDDQAYPDDLPPAYDSSDDFDVPFYRYPQHPFTARRHVPRPQ